MISTLTAAGQLVECTITRAGDSSPGAIGGSPQPTPPAPPPVVVGETRFHRTAAIENENTARPAGGYTMGDCEAFAARFDLISCQVRGAQPMFTAAQVARMREVNPRIEIFVYSNFGATHDTALPEGYYAHNATGQRLANTTWGTLAGEPSNAGWRQHVIDLALSRFALSPWADGIFGDIFGDYPMGLGGGAVKPGTATKYTSPEWYDQTKVVGKMARDALRAAYPGKELIANGLQSGNKWPTSKRLVTHPGGLSMAMPESMGHTGSLDRWKKDLAMYTEANALGVRLYSAAKTWPDTDPQVEHDKLLFAFATLALVDNGTHALALSRSQKDSMRGEPFHQATYGTPLGEYTVNAAGIYQRAYQLADFVVNPTAAPWTGTVRGQGVTVGAWKAAVVTDPS